VLVAENNQPINILDSKMFIGTSDWGPANAGM